jgi:GT2 family glycosyltransferase
MKETLLSICIVTYQARQFLCDCLRSLREHPPACRVEVIVVDNGSTDGTLEMLEEGFPEVFLIRNSENHGYTAPMNQGLQKGCGDYLVQLNPDTLLLPGTFDKLLEFMETHPEVGICSPKVLNPDGTLQGPCRRGESRPWAVISYFLKLNRLFPKSRYFGEYLMNYMDEDATHEVAGVSGSCMLIRREVVDQIGYLDERFFAYQEDADYCLRARRAGWSVFYVPQAKLIHFGGRGGSRVEPYRSILEWHKSYWRYYRKNLAGDYLSLFNWLYYGLIGLKLLWSIGQNALRREKYAGPKR